VAVCNIKRIATFLWKNRQLFRIDAIGICVLAGESIEEWLNTIESRLSIVMNQRF
jgi:hypothetical protein